MTLPHPSPDERRQAVRGWTAFTVVGAILLAYLLLEHRLHLAIAIPYLLVLACPLMHLFHHRGHSGGDAAGHDEHKHDSRAS